MTPVVRPAQIADQEKVADLIALAGEQGLIAVGLGRVAAPNLEIHGVAVVEASRRKGHGSRIVSALEAAAVAATRLWLEVRASNAAAQALYRRLGYVETGRRPRYYGHGEDAVLMNHALGPDPC